LELLASIFGIDCLTCAVMSNHLHLVLRARPHVVATWSDEDVARRWPRLFPASREKDGSAAEPTEHIARRANREDRCTGHFWEGRYKCQSQGFPGVGAV